MKFMIRFFTFTIPLMVLGLSATSSAFADASNRETIVTFTEPVKVPGRVLPAGRYIFKIPDDFNEHNVVEIFSADTNRFVTLVMGSTDYRVDTPNAPVITLEKRPGDDLQSIHSWFYVGDNYGLDFQYQKAKHHGI